MGQRLLRFFALEPLHLFLEERSLQGSWKPLAASSPLPFSGLALGPVALERRSRLEESVAEVASVFEAMLVAVSRVVRVDRVRALRRRICRVLASLSLELGDQFRPTGKRGTADFAFLLQQEILNKKWSLVVQLFF